jgi:hypothetical protein
MYRRPTFVELLLTIREEMAREADYDVDFYVESVRNGMQPATDVRYALTDVEGTVPSKRTGKPARKKKSESAKNGRPRKTG